MTADLRSNPVNYQLDDLIALSKLVRRAHLQLVRIAIVGIVVLIALLIVAEAWALTGFIDWATIVVTSVVAGIALLLTSRRFRAWMWLRIMRRSPLHTAHHYEIAPSALRVVSARSTTEVRWSALPEVKLADDRLFAFLTKRQAFIIPRRSFDSDNEFAAFAAAARERWEAHHRL